jgi:KDO2-lipid IV(A) lauroyltransferase
MAEQRGSLLPAGLSQEWPVPRQAVLGSRGGPLAWAESVAVRGLLALLTRLPDGPREAFVAGAARVARALDRSHSDAARAFLRQAFPGIGAEDLERRVLEAWRHFLRVTIESSGFVRRVPYARLGEHVESVEAHPEVEALRRERRGCILVTAHLGDWECGAAVLPWMGFDPLYVVAKPPRNRPLSAHLQRAREARGLRALPRRGAMQHARTILRAGGHLAMLLDQRARTRPVLAPFFGRMARCDRSAGVLIRRLRAPVIVGAAFRVGPWRWRVRIPTVIRPEEVAGLAPAEVAARINRELEALIRSAPEQYFWLHDRYRGAEGAAAAQDEAGAGEDGEDGGPEEEPAGGAARRG